MTKGYDVLIETENSFGRKFRLVRTYREREEMADLHLEERLKDKDGVEYWSVIERGVAWSRKERENFNARHNKHGEISLEMLTDDFLYQWKPTT